MFGLSLNAFLGIAFFISGTLATFLMYHLWGYPYDKKNHKSSAPDYLVFIHRLLGYIYLGIYVYLMIQMVPRMWNYQIELPPRTVVHLCCGMLIGAILFAKLMIVWFFKHLEGPLVPVLGTSMWLCTCLVIFLSVPFSARESYLNKQALPDTAARAEKLQRVETQLREVGFEDEDLLSDIASTNGLDAGRSVLLEKCVMCHDLRHVLARNRTPAKWRSTVKRMAGLAEAIAPISDLEQWQVTAYLIAISPELVQTAKSKRAALKKEDAARQSLTNVLKKEAAQLPADAPAESVQIAKPAGYDVAVVRSLYESKCSQCHGLDEVENYGFTDDADVEDVLTRMTEKPGFEADEAELASLLYFLKTEFVK